MEASIKKTKRLVWDKITEIHLLIHLLIDTDLHDFTRSSIAGTKKKENGGISSCLMSEEIKCFVIFVLSQEHSFVPEFWCQFGVFFFLF